MVLYAEGQKKCGTSKYSQIQALLTLTESGDKNGEKSK